MAYDGDTRGATGSDGVVNIRIRPPGTQILSASFEERARGQRRQDRPRQHSSHLSSNENFLCLAAWRQEAALAHHGVAGVGAAGLNGPGAPIESATSATSLQGSTLLYTKLDHARYRTDADPSNPEQKYANFWMAGPAAATPWFSGYFSVP